MKLVIEILQDELNEHYTNHLLKSENSLFFYTITYKKLLEKLLDCEPVYLLALKGKDVIGSFPIMIKNSNSEGCIANSLPFYGSNGSIIVNTGMDYEFSEAVKKEIINEAYLLLEKRQCRAATFITNPFDNQDWYSANFQYDFHDYRIGQITSLPGYSEHIENDLLNSFEEPRTRNIKKAIKSNIVSEKDISCRYLDFLYKTHIENMEAIGGKAKPKEFFQLIPEIFENKEFAIYIAKQFDEPIAALLLFYFNNTIEYITPVIKKEYRSLQPLSLLIFEAMKDGSKMGFKYWNWGGTWKSQSGVYSFKKKWGAIDKIYHYYTKIFDKDFQKIDKYLLNQNFPYFYSYPY
jgi:hypothetical protein